MGRPPKRGPALFLSKTKRPTNRERTKNPGYVFARHAWGWRRIIKAGDFLFAVLRSFDMAGKKSTRRGGAHFFLVLFLAVVLLPLFHFDSPGAMVLAVL